MRDGVFGGSKDYVNDALPLHVKGRMGGKVVQIGEVKGLKCLLKSIPVGFGVIPDGAVGLDYDRRQ